MIIKEMNEGQKIGYEVNGTSVCLDDDLTINLAKRQKDWPVHIDVYSDEDGALVIGAESGQYYVAQFDIPATEYEEATTIEETEGTEGAATESEPPVAKALDMDKVTLSLWSLENREPVTA